jgi:hypothetical protein
MLSNFKFNLQKSDWLPLAVILVGILYSFYLLQRTPEGLFLSGDGGVKYLLAQQLASGKFQFDLDLPVQSWAAEIWQAGFYPFKPPFAYEILDKYYITFPFTFPMATAPFYRLFGFRGLYLLPLVSTWLLWISFYRVCQKLTFGKWVTSAILIALIFASPLTIYSAAYWEHTLAIALAFGGMSFWFGKRFSELTNLELILSGSLIGLSVWFREELLCLVLAIVLVSGVWVGLNWHQPDTVPKPKMALFLMSLLVTVALFFGCNILIYGHPLGAHSFQVLEKVPPTARIRAALENFQKLSIDFVAYFPLTLCLPIYLGVILFNRNLKLTHETKVLLFIGLIFICTIPWILSSAEGISLGSRTGGKQWGPRFLLILVPIVSLLSAMGLKTLTSIPSRSLRYATIVIFTALLMVGIHLNVIPGAGFLGSTQRPLLLLNYLKTQSNQVIAVSHQYMSQTLANLFRQNTFFLAEKTEDVKKLSVALHQKGRSNFLYICYPFNTCEPEKEISERSNFSMGAQNYTLQFSRTGVFGRYPVYEVSVREN